LLKATAKESKGMRNYGLWYPFARMETGQKFLLPHNGWGGAATPLVIPSLRKENVVIIALSNKFTHKTYQLKKLVGTFW
jgi:hypothetical protein